MTGILGSEGNGVGRVGCAASTRCRVIGIGAVSSCINRYARDHSGSYAPM